jgi:hypothetical protein
MNDSDFSVLLVVLDLYKMQFHFFIRHKLSFKRKMINKICGKYTKFSRCNTADFWFEKVQFFLGFLYFFKKIDFF